MAGTLLATIDEIITLVEADIPANPRDPVNQRLKLQLERILRAYFRRVAGAFPYSEVDTIYYQNVKESTGSEVRGLLDPLLAAFHDDLVYQLNGWTATVYLKGSAEMISWGKTKQGFDIAYEGPPIKAATDYAQKHCATLVTKMDQETQRRLAQTIGEGIRNKRGVPGLARDIRGSFRDMSRYRSAMIARTETAGALSQSFLDRGREMGITGKEWVTNDPCEICEENEAEGVVPMNHVFASGHDAPPAHPNCECVLAPATLRQ